MKKQIIFDKVNAVIIENLKNGSIPWKKSFHGMPPQNFISKKVYQGINFLLLLSQNFASPYYLTFLQCKNKNGKVLKGSEGLPVVYYEIKSFAEEKKDGEVKFKNFPFIRYSTVFNLQQTTLYKDEETAGLKLYNCEDILNKIEIKPVIKNNIGGNAFYNPADDFISVPTISNFDKPESYYSTLFHELIHWTGHASRLNRDMSVVFGDHSYSFEELIAEIGAAYLCNISGISTTTIKNSSAYISGWLNKIKSDSSLIFKAAVQSQKAVNFLLGGKNDNSK